MDHYQLTHFELRDAKNNNAVVLVTGTLRYKAILQRAFNQFYFSRTFEDRYRRFEWGTYIYNIGQTDRIRIENLLKTFRRTVCIEDDLTETFALGYHKQLNQRGGYTRTPLGELVYQAKPYRGKWTPQQKQAANQIVEHLIRFIKIHPTYDRAEIIAAVPPSKPGAANLPVYLVKQLATRLKKTNGTQWILKQRSTKPMKDCQTIQEKIDNIWGVFSLVDRAYNNLEQKSIILLDDIYQTGFTLNEVGRILKQAKVDNILGLVVTKTAQDIV